MKIVQVNCVFPNGSTGKIAYSIHNYLQDRGDEAFVFYGRGPDSDEEGAIRICSNLYGKINAVSSMIRGVMYDGCVLSTNRLLKYLMQIKPDVVHLHCINGNFVNIYRLLDFLKRYGFCTVLTLHAEFMYTGGCGHSIDCNQWSTRTGCGHSQKCPRWRTDMKSWLFDRSRTMWRRMKKAFVGFDEDLIVVSVSPWLMERASRSPILSGKRHCVILNGIDTGLFHPYDNIDAAVLKKEIGLGDERVIFHATASFTDDPQHIKGGYYIIELAKRMPDIRFVVAGSVREGISVPPNLTLLGNVTDKEKLARLYSMADLTVITSKKETFSMIVAESLCCGTPVVGFKAGAPEMITIREYSDFVEYGDISALSSTIKKFLSFDQKIKLSQEAVSKYSSERMCKSYYDTYAALIEEHRR